MDFRRLHEFRSAGEDVKASVSAQEDVREIVVLVIRGRARRGRGTAFRFRGLAPGRRCDCPSTGARNRVGDPQSACFDPRYELVAGTTWLFAPELADEQLDYLVIDEAGQLSLADALAAGTSARNLILLGDPLQLPHVSQAVHPEGTSLSVLAHLLGEHATVPAERGLFLEQTRRMHPDVCTFISDEVYEHRLQSHPDCALQSVGGEAGIRYLAGRAPRQLVELAGRSRADLQRDRAPARTAVPRTWTARAPARGARLHGRRRRTTLQRRCSGSRCPPTCASARSTASRARRLRSSSTPWRPRAARTRRATCASCSAATASTSRSAGRAASRISCARRRCSRRIAKTLEQMRLISTLCALSDAAAADRSCRGVRSRHALADSGRLREDDRYKLPCLYGRRKIAASHDNRDRRAERACSLGARDRRRRRAPRRRATASMSRSRCPSARSTPSRCARA